MNPRVTTLFRIVCILLIPILFTVGCAKREAQKAMTQAEAARDEAQKAQAPGYAKKAYNDANRLMNLAKSQMDSGDYKQAAETATQAQARFISAKEQVPAIKQRVDTLMTQIEQALTSADESLKKAREGGKISADDINPVSQIVDGLRTRLEGEIRTDLDEEKMKAFLTETQDALKKTEALASAQLKPDAAAAKDEIQKLITNAKELKADKHEAERYNQVQTQLAELENAERDGQWQKVIDLVEKMKAPLNELISLTQQKAAGDILADLQDKINKTKQLNIPNLNAFSGAVAQADDAVKKGLQDIQGQNFAAAAASADQARNSLNQAYQALGQEAQKMVETAKSNLDQAIKQEADKYAPTVVTQVRESIAGIEELLKNQQFLSAYTAARQTVQASSGAISAGRRGKAQIVLSKAETPFSILHGQGGAQYAPEAYQSALSALQDLRNKMKNEEFDAVEAGVPAVVDVVSKGVQALSDSAVAFIAKAQQALDDAKTAKAQEWVGMQYANAVNMKSAAEKELEKQRFLSCIRNCEASIQAARIAEAKAYSLQSDQNLRKANDLVVTAKRAEQDRLSPLEYNRSLQLTQDSTDLLKKGQAKEAYQSSVKTLEAADRALNNLVMTAREKSDSALAAEAMTYSQPEITQALSLLNEAEEAQDAQQFPVANEKSQASAKLADQAEYFTWKQRSIKLLQDLEGLPSELEFQLAPIKTPALYHEAITNLTEAKVKQIDEDYKASYRYGDLAVQGKQEIWNRMREEMNRTLAELKQTSAWLGENSQDDSGRQLNTQLMQATAELDRLVALESWREAYTSAEKAKQVSRKVTESLEKRNRKIFSYQLKESLKPYKEQDALNIVPDQDKKFKTAFNTINKPKKGDTYGKAYEEYQSASKNISDLSGTITATASQRTEEITSILQQAEEAGALKYYKDWHRTLATDLQWLRNSLRGNDYKGISAHLTQLEKDAPALLMATKEAVAVDDYLKKLDVNLSQMNNLIQDFGYITQIPKDLIITARATEHALDKANQDMYKVLQGKISATTLRINAESLEDKVKDLQPPKAVGGVQKKAISSFIHFRKAAEGFEQYGESEAYDLKYRERALENAYVHLNKVLDLNEDLRFVISSARKMNSWEKFNWNVQRLEDKIADFYYSYAVR